MNTVNMSVWIFLCRASTLTYDHYLNPTLYPIFGPTPALWAIHLVRGVLLSDKYVVQGALRNVFKSTSYSFARHMERVLALSVLELYLQCLLVHHLLLEFLLL